MSGNPAQHALNCRSPRAFVSYSWSSTAHEQWVIDLAEKLTADGVHVIIDKWDLKEGQDKYAFMERIVTDPGIQKVLMICDRQYAQKADDRKGGVGTESQIISPEIYAKVDQQKFVPIISEVGEDGHPFLPAYLKGRIYIDLAREEKHAEEYEKLLRNIYDRPAHRRPPLGTPPSYLTEDDQPRLKTVHKFARFRDAIVNGKPHARAAAIDYLEALVVVHADFMISGESGAELDEDVLKQIEAFKPYRDEFVEFMMLCARYGVDSVFYEKVFEFLERVLEYHHPARDVRRSNVCWSDQFRFIHRELFLYLVAVLIKERSFEAIDRFLEEPYFYSTHSDRRYERFTVFDDYVRSLEEYRNSRLQLRRVSVVADLTRDRADNSSVSFENLMEAELVLAARSVLSDEDDGYWYPRLLVYAGRWGSHGFDLFERGQSHRHFEAVKRLLKVESKQDLIRRLERARATRGIDRWNFDGWPIVLPGYMNLEKLDTI